MEFLADSIGLLDYASNPKEIVKKEPRVLPCDYDKSDKTYDDNDDEDCIFSKYVKEKVCHNGAIFTGRVDALTGELLHGYGLYVEQQEAYEGPFNKEGQRHGQGAVCTKLDGSGKFLGSFQNDSFHYGTYVTNEFTYTGSFGEASLFEGTGTLMKDDGTLYEGQFSNGVYHGRGRLVETENRTFDGCFVNGEKHGVGKLTYETDKCGSYCYRGDWKHNTMNGNGTETIESERSSYTGEFQDNLRHGVGTLKCPNAEMTGSWCKGRPVDGHGWVINYPKKNISYVGEVMGCRPHGQGTMVYRPESGGTTVYEGSFRCGLRHGRGKIVSDEEGEYDGEWRGDEPLANLNGHDAVVSTKQTQAESTEHMLEILGPKADKEFISSSSVPELLELLESSCSDFSDSNHFVGSLASSSSCHSAESTYLNYKGAKSVGDDEWVYDNGDTYSGHIDAFQNRHGFGIFTHTCTGTVYSGEWNMSRRNGRGNQTNPLTGVQYSGDFVANTMKGKGQMTLTDGSKYSGEFCDGIMHGRGRFADAICGSSYVGRFEFGVKHGEGEETTSDGSIYSGEFRNGKQCGQGSLYEIDGETKKLVYKGQWEDGAFSGAGEKYELTNPSCATFQGDFVEGKRHGHGSLKTISECIYEGPWSNDKPEDGDWVISCPGGSVFYGAATCDPEKESGLPIPNGFGTHKDTNGAFYTGSFVDGERHGSGLCVFSGGEQWDGKWEKGIFVNYNRACP